MTIQKINNNIKAVLFNDLKFWECFTIGAGLNQVWMKIPETICSKNTVNLESETMCFTPGNIVVVQLTCKMVVSREEA